VRGTAGMRKDQEEYKRNRRNVRRTEGIWEEPEESGRNRRNMRGI